MDTETRISETTDAALWALWNSRVKQCTFVEEKRYAEDGSILPEDDEIDPRREMYQRRAGTPLFVEYINRGTGAVGFRVDRENAPHPFTENSLYDFEEGTYTTATHIEDDESITFIVRQWDQHTDLVSSECRYLFPKR